MSLLLPFLANRKQTALEVAIFGLKPPAQVDATIDAFVQSQLGTIEEVRFYRPGSGLVIGVRCAGVGNVVLKVHRQASVTALAAIQEAQVSLANAGFPTRLPLLAPTALGEGLVTAEAFVASDVADGRSPAVRRELARRLWELIDHLRTMDQRSIAVLPAPAIGASPWGEPHDLRFDFPGTAAGAGWIDQIALDAHRVVSEASLPEVVTHLDWRAQNVAFGAGEVVGVYDWDSVARVPEAVAVGQASAHFSTDWTLGHETLPTVLEMHAFVADYEAARGAAFTEKERRVIVASRLKLIAYAARCEHSDSLLFPHLVPVSSPNWRELLSECARDRR